MALTLRSSRAQFAIGCFNDDFVRADAGEAVVEPDRGGFERALDPHGGVTVGHDANAPAGFVGLRFFLADRVDLRRREPFVALGKGIEGPRFAERPAGSPAAGVAAPARRQPRCGGADRGEIQASCVGQ